MPIKIKFDPVNNPELPILILAKKNGEKFGVLKYRNLVVKDCLSNPTEINFIVDKYLDGEKNNFWDEILNFRTIYCDDWDMWFELTMDIDETDNTIKIVSGVELSQAELSQIMLYNIEINTETDIEREDYIYPTILYNKNNPVESLLDRIMEKAGHYSIEYVSPTIAGIQRTFTFNDTSLYDAFNKIAEEINCLFVFNSGTKPDGKIARGISVFDLEANCLNCGHRGEFTKKCPKCNSENIDEGYGENTAIFVTADEIAKSVKLSTDVGAVKNCFKLQAGDDLMTATVRNCNPNGTNYIWYLSNAVKEDMSDELKTKISTYNINYNNYQINHKYIISPAQAVGNYDMVIKAYQKYNSELSTMPNPIWGYTSLVNEYYNATDFLIYLQSVLMPDASLSDTNASIQLSQLTSVNLSPVSVVDLNNISLSTANNAILSLAKAIVDFRYKVDILESSLVDYRWKGKFVVTNYSDETDTSTGDVDVEVLIDNNYENFLKQKMFESLSKNNSDLCVSELFDTSKSLSEFRDELKKYCLDSLLNFKNICQSCLDILIEQDVSASWDSEQDSLYNEVYSPYLQRMMSIDEEIKTRESEIFIVQTLKDKIEDYIADTHSALDFQKYIGDDLWNEFVLYRREDKYSNDNYISDGLSNGELIKKASEFISVAEKEIFKSAELQHSISASLKDFLVIDKFKPLVDYFNVGNWIRVRIDDEIYKLRLLSYEIDFDNLEDISVEFSDVFKTIDGYADQESVISSAAKMSSSYPATQRQASLGEQSQRTIDAWYLNGINTANTKIVNEADDQCQVWDRHGMLFKKFDPIKNDYNPNQMKIINSTIALTTDNWTTTKMAIGLFRYIDPNTQEEKEVYGVNGETIIGNLLLGKNLNITNDTGSMMFDGNGLTVSNGINTITINPNNTYLFNIKNKKEDLLSFDETDGSLKIVGNIIATNLKLTNTLDYDKLLYVDSDGLVTGIKIDTELNEVSTNPVQNKVIASNFKIIEESLEANAKDITALKIANQQTEGTLNGVREDVELSKTNIEANTSDINNINAEINSLKGRVSANTQLANDIESDVETKVNSINSEINALKGRVSANTQLANDIETNVQTNTADIANNKKTIGILQGTLGFEAKNKFNNTTTSSTVSGVTFTVNDDGTITAKGTATANITFQLKPNLYIQNNNWTGNIFSFGVIESSKKYRGLIQYYNSSWTLQNSTYLSSTETTLLDYYCAVASIYITKGTTLSNVVFKPMIRDANIEDDSYSSYGGLSVIKRFDRFSTQKLLYSTTTSNASPLKVNVSNLFANYSAVVCYIKTSISTTPYNLTLPLKYIKSLGSGNYYNADSQLMFEYVDDSNLRILTGMAQSNPTIESARIINLY